MTKGKDQPVAVSPPLVLQLSGWLDTVGAADAPDGLPSDAALWYRLGQLQGEIDQLRAGGAVVVNNQPQGADAETLEALGALEALIGEPNEGAAPAERVRAVTAWLIAHASSEPEEEIAEPSLAVGQWYGADRVPQAGERVEAFLSAGRSITGSVVPVGDSVGVQEEGGSVLPWGEVVIQWRYSG